MSNSNIPSVVDLALAAEKRIAQMLRELKEALESGQDERAVQIARELTKAKEYNRAA